ncbi:hypothetical protein [Pseudomonas sp. Au-Pse12]|uniref:hypothetical protein n=1 Tax=Pseudomonas sp. Au-Pse12 TaxID=2906459 RepID=UPI001E3753BF|nr:hypothetical protein [Pseudomonas sp. Au-Pse12]MCE4053927.1 hypothetical protein [Pseudomonas sp. Au-Pse12]
MPLVNPLSVVAVPAGRLSGVDEIAARQGLFESLRGRGQAPSPVDAEAARQDRLAFWLSAQVHALYLGSPDAQRCAAEAHPPACAAPERCRYCQQEFDLLHKRAALLVLGRSGLLEV